MTFAVENTPDGEGGGSKALSAPYDSGLEPFAAVGTDRIESGPPRGIGSRLLDYSAHAAMIVGLVGFAWTVSNHVVSHPASSANDKAAHAAAPAAMSALAPATKQDEVADLRHANQQLADDVKHLRATVDSLKSAVRDDKTSAQVRVLQAGLENVQSGLNATKTELSTKLDKIEHEPAPKIQQVIERLGKLEKATNLDTGSTGSIPSSAASSAAKSAAVVPTPPSKPKLANAEAAAKVADAHADESAAKPQVLAGYVVRDVYDGVAIIEGRRGQMEVVPGVSIPGAGVVKSIDRHGNGWTVTTTKGVLAYAAPAHDYRRASYGRNYYPAYREDF